MLNEILNEFDKVREKDKLTRNSVRDLIKGLKGELKSLDQEIESNSNTMNVKYKFRIFIGRKYKFKRTFLCISLKNDKQSS